MNVQKAERMKKITNSCIVCGYCNDPTVSFFTFPRDPLRKKQWMDNLGFPSSVEVFHRRVCSKHFNPEDFIKSGTSGRRILLKKTSLPRLNSPSTSHNISDNFNHLRCTVKLDRLRKSRRVVHSCYICGVNRDEAVSHFQFPSESSINFFWIDACNMDPTVDISNLFLCSKHFLDEDFVGLKQKLQLKKNAIPTQFMKQSKKITHSCIICGVGREENMSYFGLPKTNEMRLLWEEACGIQMPKSDCQYRICSRHFVPDDFTNNKLVAIRLRLKRTAVPSLFLNVERKSAVRKKVNNENVNVEMRENPSVVEIQSCTIDSQSTLCSPSSPDIHFVELPISTNEMNGRLSSQEIIMDHEYSVKGPASPSLDFYVEEVTVPISDASIKAKKCIRLQRELIKKQQKDIEILQQRLRKARQKIRILEGLGVQLQETKKAKKGVENLAETYLIYVHLP